MHHATLLTAALVCLVGCGRPGDWRAARADYCARLALIRADLDTTFIALDNLAKLVDADGVSAESLADPCALALEQVHEAKGLLHGLLAAEGALAAGAPNRTDERAMFVVPHDADDGLLALALGDRTALRVACARADRTAIRAWLARGNDVKRALHERFDLQAKDCTAVGAGAL